MAPGSRAPKTPEEALSRALAKTLRHAAKSQGIPQTQDGWCRISDLLSHAPYTSMKATPEKIYNVVSTDKKGRYELNEDKSEIRAVQGHSVDVDVGLKPLTTVSELPEKIIHGTYRNVWPLIKETGLDKMTRQYIHMTSKTPQEGGISGIRQSADVYIYIDGPRALNSGVRFFESKNGVILSPDRISSELFAYVSDSHGNEIN